MHRIIIGDDPENINILDTYITDTRDLFILIKSISDHLYKVYHLDLDACNDREKDETSD